MRGGGWERVVLGFLATAMVGTARPQPFSLDTTFRVSADTWYVSSIAPLADGSLLLSGRLRFPGDPVIWNFRPVSKVFADGQLDTEFPTAVPGGGKLYEWNGRYYVGTNTLVRRIWPDGTLDTDFILMNSGPYFSSLQGGDYHVYADGRVLMSGVHVLSDTVRGFVGDHCLVWFSNTGYLDTTQHHRKCLGSLNVFQALPDGRFIGSGSTGTWDGQAASNIIRFHTDGELDTTFQANVWWGQAYGFLPLADGRVYAAGAFRITGITDTLRLVRFMPDGSLDPTFNNFLDFDVVEVSGPVGGVPSFLHQLDAEQLIITGGFERVDDQVRKGLCLVDTAGNLLDDHFEDGGVGNYVYQGSTLGTVRGIMPVLDDHWYIWGSYHGYDDGTLHDPQQRMVSRLHGLHTGVVPLPAVGTQAQLSIHPNPADAWVALDYDLLVPPQNAALVLRDMNGREVYRKALHHQKEQVVWDVRAVASGTYTATLVLGERSLRTEKIVIKP